MSLFLYYVDEGPLEDLEGYLGQGLMIRHIAEPVRLRGEPFRKEHLVILGGFSSAELMQPDELRMHRELFRLLCRRQAAGYQPCLFFHWEQTAKDDLDALGIVDASVGSAAELYSLLQTSTKDVLLRFTEVSHPLSLEPVAILEQRLAEGDCPNLTGIVRGDGAVVLMEQRPGYTPGAPPILRRLVQTSLAAYWEFNLNEWVGLSMHPPSSWEQDGVELITGQGEPHSGFEHAGFVAVRNLTDGRLRWAAFFEHSGVFSEARMLAGEVVVTSAHAHRWHFPLEQPERVRVVKPAPEEKR